MNNSKCDWIEDLITAVFISHTKILTSIGPSNTFNKINVTIPKTTSFIHKAYVNLARELWKNPYLFNENVPGHEYQRNSKEIENIIKQCVEGTVRQLLPIKEILREHLDTYESDNTLTSKEDIKQLLKEELQELKNQIINSDSGNNEDKEDKEDKETESFQVTKEDQGEGQVEDQVEDQEESPKEQLKELVISDLPSEDSIVGSVTEPTIESEPVNVYLSESKDDPSEEQIKKQVTDIVVNDITIPVSEEVGVSKISEVKEITYDNADIMGDKEEVNDEEKVKKMLTNLEPISINVIKNDTINDTEPEPEPGSGPEPQLVSELPISDNSSFKLDNIFGLGTTKVEEPKVEEPKVEEPKVEEPKVEEPKVEEPKVEEPKVEEPKVEEPKVESTEPKVESTGPKSKEIINIDSNDIDETSSLANFFNDMKQVVEDKGIKVEDSNNFTLFEDASESG